MTSTTATVAIMKAGAWNGGGETGGAFSRVGGLNVDVEEDEMFLFDEDLSRSKQVQQQSPFRNKTCSPAGLVMHDLEYMTLEDRKQHLTDEEDETLLSVSKTENNFLRPRRFPHFYGHSPGDLASSADSELSASITIEGLRDHLQSCFTCGVLWRENQASLDCHECDGYALTRPCMDCNGNCTAIWTRDLTTSHQTHKAKFQGSCKLILRNCSIGTESCESSIQLSDN